MSSCDCTTDDSSSLQKDSHRQDNVENENPHNVCGIVKIGANSTAFNLISTNITNALSIYDQHHNKVPNHAIENDCSKSGVRFEKSCTNEEKDSSKSCSCSGVVDDSTKSCLSPSEDKDSLKSCSCSGVVDDSTKSCLSPSEDQDSLKSCSCSGVDDSTKSRLSPDEDKDSSKSCSCSGVDDPTKSRLSPDEDKDSSKSCSCSGVVDDSTKSRLSPDEDKDSSKSCSCSGVVDDSTKSCLCTSEDSSLKTCSCSESCDTLETDTTIDDSQDKPLEFTLAIIKPDGMLYRNEIEREIMDEGFQICQRRWLQLTPEQASDFYLDDYKRKNFAHLIAYMSSEPILVFILSKCNAIKEWRALMGPKKVTNARINAPNSIRGKYGRDDEDLKNVVHGSDNQEAAEREITFFFADLIKEPLMDQEDTVEYLKEYVNGPLADALLKCCEERPNDPVSWLGNWLLEHNANRPKYLLRYKSNLYD